MPRAAAHQSFQGGLMPQIDLDSELLDYLIRSDLRPGDRLPTINELQADEHLGISISKVREQLEVARALGIVEVRSRTGMKLKPYNFTPAVRLSLFYALAQDPGYFDGFRDLRNHLEIAYWEEACARLLDDDKQAMRDTIARARAKLNSEAVRIPNQEHREFHMRLFARLDNLFVTGLLEAYWDAYEAVESNRYSEYAYLQQVWDYHERILNAIAADQIGEAQRLFVEHTRLIRFRREAIEPPGERMSPALTE